MEKWLLKASISELRDFLRGRFQGIGPHAADTGTPVAELPPDVPLELWEKADATLRGYIIQALRGLLDEVPGNGWTPRAVEWLDYFIAVADIRDQRLIERLADAARSLRWLKNCEDGPRCLASLLRTLLDLGWEPEPGYWLHLPEEMKSRYPGLVFRGLLGSDTDGIAFSYLRGAVKDRKHARQVIDVLADFADQDEFRTRLVPQLECAVTGWPPEASAYLRKRFSVLGWGNLAPGAPKRRAAAIGEHVCWRREELLPVAAVA